MSNLYVHQTTPIYPFIPSFIHPVHVHTYTQFVEFHLANENGKNEGSQPHNGAMPNVITFHDSYFDFATTAATVTATNNNPNITSSISIQSNLPSAHTHETYAALPPTPTAQPTTEHHDSLARNKRIFRKRTKCIKTLKL